MRTSSSSMRRRLHLTSISRQGMLIVAWACLSLLTGAVLLSSQRQGEEDLRQRFDDRVAVAARFTATYARDLLAQERRVAAREMAGANIGRADLERVSNLFGYEAAVVLDRGGRLMQIFPAKPSLIGQTLTEKYPHLAAAAAGSTAVSKVVPSAAKGIPIVAFATPFDTTHGRRIFSGAFDVQETPIGAYLANATPFPGARIYLLDSAGTIVASNRKNLVGLQTIAQADRELPRALLRATSSATANGYQYSSRPVTNTPWQLVMSAPSAQLLQPVSGTRRYVPWMLWAGFVLGSLACALLVANLIRSRTRFDHLARTDALTGLSNRWQMQTSLDAAIATARRHDQPLCVLMIDIDHFKAINDNHGHDVGDEVLRSVAKQLRESLRAGDLVGRWGGEEFLALLPSTDLDAVNIVSERLRIAISSTPLIINNQLIPVSVSIGAAAFRVDRAETVVTEADAAMYAAKAAGRDRVHVAR